jgi:hypothetical protein
MSTSLTSQAANPARPAAHGVVSRWGAPALLVVATSYAASSVALHPVTMPETGAIGAAMHPLVLFAIGLAPMLGAAIVVWSSRHALSREERRSQLTGAAMSAVLFFQALLLVRLFG